MHTGHEKSTPVSNKLSKWSETKDFPYDLLSIT